MTDTATRVAHPMPGIPRTADEYDIPHARWYRMDPAITQPGADIHYVAVTKSGVYSCDSQGRGVNFTRCLYRRPAVTPSTTADALAHLGAVMA